MSTSDDVLQDVCPLNDPPTVYGKTLEEVEATNQRVVERFFRDQDGILLCSLNARTMKPYTADDVKNRPNGVGAFTEHSDIPAEAKVVWMNYENSGQASGIYLDALCTKAKVTGDKEAAKLASRTVQAIATLWENAAHVEHPNGGSGRGWFPKPYLGIHNLKDMHECSMDQYVDITLGLHSYYLTLANEDEKRLIERIIISFAEWWYDHDYAGIYFGKAIWWKRLPEHPVAACFLYLNALANSWSPSAKFQHGFEIWRELQGAMTRCADPVWVCMNGIPLKCMEKLIDLRPDLADDWLRVAQHHARILVTSIEEPKRMNRVYETAGFAANYLSTAHRLMPEAGYDKHVLSCLRACNSRGRYYHLRRGEPVANLSVRESGEDFRDALLAECHVHWLAGYWRSRPEHS